MQRAGLSALLCAGICLALLTGCEGDRDTRVAAALTRGADFLHGMQQPSGEISDTLNPLFNTWETVEAASALLAIAGDRNAHSLGNAARYLAQQEAGLNVLCHNTACKGVACLETTAEYFLFLSDDGASRSMDKHSATGCIHAVRSLHQADGAWQIGNPDVRIATTFPSVSGFALAMLNHSPLSSDSTTAMVDSLQRSTITWLLSQQSDHGDWGSAWEYYGCPGYALWAILRGLQPHADDPKVASAINKATTFIRTTQVADGSWYHSLPPNPQQHGTASIKQTSSSLQTALMLAALLATQPSKNDPNLGRGVDFLLQAQTPNGSWDGGYFPIPHARYEKREYLFATAMALRVLAAYRDLQPSAKP